MKIQKKNKNICLAGTVVTFICYFLFYFIYNNLDPAANHRTLIYMLSVVQIFIIIYIIKTWEYISNKIFTPYIFVAMFLVLYGCGQSLLWVVNLNRDMGILRGLLYGVYVVHSDTEIVRMMLYINICLMFFHLGALFCLKDHGGHINSESYEKLTKNILFAVSAVVLALCVSLVFGKLNTVMEIVSYKGYAALYHSDSMENTQLLQIANELFVPSLIGLLIGSDYKKSVVVVCYVIFGIYAIGYSIAGSRGSWFPYFIVFLWLHIRYRGGFKKKTVIWLLILGFLLMYLLQLIMLLRSGGGIDDLFTLEQFPLFSLLSEMGGSAGVTLIALAQKIHWPYSNSILAAVLSSATTRVATMFNLDVVAGANWFSQDVLRLNWGTGFSIFVEMYVNYNEYIAPLLMFIIGWMIASLVYENDTARDTSTLRLFILSSTMGILVVLGRCALLELTRKIVRGVLLYALVVIVIRSLIRSRRG